MTATLLVWGFIMLGTLGGTVSGFDVQVKKLGSGTRSMLITTIIIIVFGSAIMTAPLVRDGVDALRQGVSDSFLGQGFAFSVFSYVVLFVCVLLLIKVCTATIASFTAVKDGQGDWVNKVLGGVLACTLCVAFVMLVITIMSVIPGASQAISNLQQSSARVFYYNNVFMSLMGLS